MIIDINTGIIHKQNSWGTMCGMSDGSFSKVVDTNVIEGDSIFCNECFKEKTPKQKRKGVKTKGDEK